MESSSNVSRLNIALELIEGMTNAELQSLKHRMVEVQQARSRLLKLPPELRNRVYYFVSMNTIHQLLSHCASSDQVLTAAQLHPAMAKVCRQIRQEFTSFYLSDDMFYMERVEHLSSGFRWSPIKLDLGLVNGIIANADLSKRYKQSLGFRRLFNGDEGILRTQISWVKESEEKFRFSKVIGDQGDTSR